MRLHVREGLELLLQGCQVLLNVHAESSAADKGVHSNSDYDGLARSLLDEGSLEEETKATGATPDGDDDGREANSSFEVAKHTGKHWLRQVYYEVSSERGSEDVYVPAG